MRRVILVTGHYYQSKRRAGFHWLADAYHRAGWEVIFMTIGFSWLSWLRRDHRLHYPIRREAGHLKWVKDHLASYVWFTPYHPVNFHFAAVNRLVRPLFVGYEQMPLGEIESLIPGAATIIFESSYGLALFERFRRLNGEARFIYRVSDDLRLLRVHPLIREAEDRTAPLFDLVSVPSAHLFQRFAKLPNAAVQHHGVQKGLFDQATQSPYEPNTFNLVFVGSSRLDMDFVRRAAALFPQWRFHIIGPLGRLPDQENISSYGEIPFVATVPYIKHADIGLQTLAYAPGAECFTDSLKMIQYQYCRLPVVAPEYLRSDRTGVFYYRPGDDDSIRAALTAAGMADRAAIMTTEAQSWDEIVATFESYLGGSSSQIVNHESKEANRI